MIPYKFSHWVSDTPPTTEVGRIIEKSYTSEKLTREEKDILALALINSSSYFAYKHGGWAWSVAKSPQVRLILVQREHSRDWVSYYAPDKTSLRKALGVKSSMLYVSKDHR